MKLLAENIDETNINQTIADLIAKHDPSLMLVGVDYYNNDTHIKGRQIWYYEDGQKKVDTEATNHRVSHDWHKLLVDQKVAYLLGRPPVVTAEDEQFAEQLNVLLDETWDDRLQELAKNASNKGVEWLMPFIDAAGNFRYIIIPAEQCIPVYETDYEEELVAMLRYYPAVVAGETKTRAEWWTAEGVSTYIETEAGVYALESEDGHFFLNGTPMGWGRVPFVEFANNEERFADLKYYKELIDVYDLVISDLANDLTDIQKLIFVLKGYGGQSLTEFVQNLRYYRAIQVDPEAGAGVETLSVDPAITAIDSFLNRVEENIFIHGQGVNVKTDTFGSAPSGIALKFLYSLLDLKSNIMARRFSVAIKKFCWFAAKYLDLKGVGTFNSRSVKITYNKSLLINDLELSQIAESSMGIISQETIVAHHPWVEDAQAELTRLQSEQESKVDLSRYLQEGDEQESEGEQPGAGE
jgi:SPP1 family phage portal protein